MAVKSDTKKTKKVSSKKTQKSWVSNVVIERNISTPSESNVSIITKTTNPRVIVKSEKMDNNCDYNYSHPHTWKNQILKFVCLIIMCMIILATFFLSLKTYNMMNELILLQ